MAMPTGDPSPKPAPRAARAAGDRNQAVPENALDQPGALTVEDASSSLEHFFDDEDEAGGREGSEESAEVEEAEQGSEESEEAEEDSEESEEGEDEEEGEAEPELETDGTELTVPIVVDGETRQVPLSELQRSYLQQADYTRKTTQLAEERRAFEGHANTWRQERQRISEMLDQALPAVVAHLRASQKSPEELERLKTEDPGQWSAYMHERRMAIEQVREARRAREELEANAEAERRRELEASAPREMAALMAVAPRFRMKDGGFNQKHYAAVGEFLTQRAPQSIRLRPEEWAELYDHRLIAYADLAMQAFDAARSVKRAAPSLAKLARPIRPGSPAQQKRTPRETEERVLRARQRRLRESGSLSDAADLLESYL